MYNVEHSPNFSFNLLVVSFPPHVGVFGWCVCFPPQLQSDLDQEYQDKFRRLPVEIQEFVQDSSKAKLRDDAVHGNLVASSTTEKLNHKASQSEDDMEEGSSERVYDTPL